MGEGGWVKPISSGFCSTTDSPVTSVASNPKFLTVTSFVSGIRGTIGGKTGDNLTPLDTVKFAAAYGTWLKNESGKENLKVVVGRDARISGKMIQELTMNTLTGLGIDVIDLGNVLL